MGILIGLVQGVGYHREDCLRPLSTTLCALLLFSALEAIAPQLGLAQTDYGARLGVRSGSETSYTTPGPCGV